MVRAGFPLGGSLGTEIEAASIVWTGAVKKTVSFDVMGP